MFSWPDADFELGKPPDVFLLDIGGFLLFGWVALIDLVAFCDQMTLTKKLQHQKKSNAEVFVKLFSKMNPQESGRREASVCAANF